jgi:hypothetical protein
MKVRACLLLALLVACGSSDGHDFDKSAGQAGRGGSGGAVGAMGSVDCSDQDENQTLSCSAPELCCAVPNAANHCAASCDTTLVLRCDDDGDCGSGACCWNRNSTTGSACRDACDDGYAPLCARSSDCPSALPCCLGSVLNGVYSRFCIEEQDFGCL